MDSFGETSSYQSARTDTLPDASAWKSEIANLLAREQPFLAFDVSERARQLYPHDLNIRLLGIIALFRGHSTEEARQQFQQLQETIPESPKPELAEPLANIYQQMWEHWGERDDLHKARSLFADLFNTNQDPQFGINAAILSWSLGDQSMAKLVAENLLRDITADNGDRLGIKGHALLLLGQPDAAIDAYRHAVSQWGEDYRPVVAALKVVRNMAAMGINVADTIETILAPPRIVIFGGQPIDVPGMEEAIFPPSKEAALKQAIEQKLADLDARIGYCSGACGGDILFAEAMLERGAELHLVLPNALDDFIQSRVAYAGEQWVARFNRIQAHATTVTYATKERYLGHTNLLRYANSIIMGMGWLRADLLLAQPHLLAAWDYRGGNTPGNPADLIDHWPDITSLHLIELDELDSDGTDAAVLSTPAILPTKGEQRVIRAMLFADVAGYSKLGEEFLPNWFKLLEKVKELFDQTGNQPDLIEEWGDAFYIVMPNARALLNHAFRLREAFTAFDHRDVGLPYQLNIRIGLHAGPVFTTIHPVTGRAVFSGRQVNRAARIEPITMPGEVYASLEFVGLLTAEENAVKHELAFTGEAYHPWYRAEYLGVIDMPKKHGQQPIYHLLPAFEKPRPF